MTLIGNQVLCVKQYTYTIDLTHAPDCQTKMNMSSTQSYYGRYLNVVHNRLTVLPRNLCLEQLNIYLIKLNTQNPHNRPRGIGRNFERGVTSVTVAVTQLCMARLLGIGGGCRKGICPLPPKAEAFDTFSFTAINLHRSLILSCQRLLDKGR